MATIILSQTLVLSGGKMEQCKKLRVCSKVDSKGIAVASAWRDADKDLPIQSAKDQLEALGYKESQDFVRVTLIGNGRAHRTRIVRMTKVVNGAQDTKDAPKTNMDQVNEQMHEAEEGLPQELIEEINHACLA